MTKHPTVTSPAALQCRICGQQYAVEPLTICEECFGPLEPDYDLQSVDGVDFRKQAEAGPQTLWRYESLLPGASEGHLGALFREAGLVDVVESQVVARLDHATFDEWWAPFERGVGPAGQYVASLTPEGVEALRARCRELQPAAPFTVEAIAWAARGAAAG